MREFVIYLLCTFGFLFLQVHGGFLQLWDREEAFTLNGSNYRPFSGSDVVFSSHPLGSQTYTITMWIQETQATANGTILQMQQSGASSSSGSPGTMVPYLSNTPISVTGCIDTSVTTNQCKTLEKDATALYTWTHYFISVCKSSSEMRICFTSWQGTSTCGTESLSGDIYPFETTSTAYFGGSPYGGNIVGKLVDIRFYDTSCYTTSQAQFLASNRRCASPCWNSCWGPDDKSCSGLEFLHPYFSYELDESDTINVGRLEFAATDIKFKGHTLGKDEMSACAWIYSSANENVYQDVDVFRASNTSSYSGSLGDRILSAVIFDTYLKVYSSVTAAGGTATEITCTISHAVFTNKWVHISASISQSTGKLICCIFAYDSTEQAWSEANLADGQTVTPLNQAADSKIVIGKISTATTKSLGGRVVDFKFFPTQALTADDFKSMVLKTKLSWAPSCNQCWGPDTFSCKDYVQLLDPRKSQTFTSQGDEKIWNGDNAVFSTSNYTHSTSSWSISSWIYNDITTMPTYIQDAFIVIYNGSWWTTSAFIGFKIDHKIQSNNAQAGCANDNVQVSGSTYANQWVHITLGVDQTTQTLCITPFSLNNPVTTCQTLAIPSAEPWDRDPVSGTAMIELGRDGDSSSRDKFRGKMVDARYYPNSTLKEDQAKKLVAAFTCVDGSQECTGPDAASVYYLALSEPSYEYYTADSGGEGLSYFLISAAHYNHLRVEDVSSQNYAISVWVTAEERIDDTEVVRFYGLDVDACTNNQPYKIPAVHVTATSTVSKIDTIPTWGQQNTHTISPANHRFGTSFNVFVSACSNGHYYNCYTEYGGSTDCSKSTLSEILQPFPSNGASFLGGTKHNTSTKLRVTDFRYHPTTCPSGTAIGTSLSAVSCHTQCGGECYGPGSNSCIYEEPLFLSDEWEPWVGNGSTTHVTMQGSDVAFESRYMKYPNYSLSLWFKLNTLPAVGTEQLILAVMTDAVENISNALLKQAPQLIIQNDQIAATMVDDNDVVVVGSGISVSIDTWYLACVVVSQVNELVTLHVAPLGGAVTTKVASFTGANAGYFSQSGYFYYGGIVVSSSHIRMDGQILDIRFWDTKALEGTAVAEIYSSKGCYPHCSKCTGLEYNTCTECESPYVLNVAGNECIKTCPDQTYNDGTQCQNWDTNCKVLTCKGPNECTECNNSYYRLNGGCYTVCSEGFEDQSTSPDYQCSTWYTGCKTCTSSAYDSCTACTDGNYKQPTSSICANTCPTGHVTDSTTNSCVACPANCAACTSLTECTSCESSYVMRDDKLCYTSCPDGQYADATNTCVSWYATCATCDSYGENICITCITGLPRLNVEEQSGSCDCSDMTDLSKEAKIACAPVRQATSSSTEDMLQELDDLIQNEVLTVNELTDVVTAMDSIDTSLNDTQSSEVLHMIQHGGMTTLINMSSDIIANQVTVVTEKFDAQFELNTVEKFEGASVATSSGCGVDIPSDLADLTPLLPDGAFLVFSVIQLKPNQTDVEVVNPDTLTIDVNYIALDGSTEKVKYDNLTSNFTINFDEQNYDMEQTYKCMWFNVTGWIEDGTSLDSITNGTASCLTNHLTEFSVRSATDSAAVPNNAAATVNFGAVSDYDISKNPTPIIVCGTILVLFIITYIISHRLDRRDRKVAAEMDDTFVVPVTASMTHNNSTTNRSHIRQQRQSSGLNDSSSKPLTSLPNENQDQDNDPKNFNPLRGVLSEIVHEPVIKQNILKQNLEIHPMFGAFEEDSGVPQKTKAVMKSNSKISIDSGKTGEADTSWENKQAEEEQEEVKPEFKQTFMASHPFFRIFVVGDPKMARTERLIIFLVVVMISIFTTGMFYNTDEEEEEDKSLWDALTDYSWTDFWIVLYSSLITIPVPLVLRCFYQRSEIDPREIPWVQEQKMLRRRCVGHLIAFIAVGWCCWSVLAFSLEFGHNNTINWMLAFAGTEMFDLAIKDNLITLTIVIIIFCMINEKEKSLEQAGTLKKVIGHFI